MINRKLSSPIFSALVLSLFGNSPLLSHAQSSDSNSAPSAQTAPTGTTTISDTPSLAAKHTFTYTVLAGDSLTTIARKFNTTRKKLRKLNDLSSSSSVKPGQELLVPSLSSAKTASASTTPKAKTHHYAVAQPVQDFDVPASTFASCPVPLPSEEDDAASTAPEATEKPAPIAKLVSPAEMAAERSPEKVAPIAPAPEIAQTEVAPINPPKIAARKITSYPPTVPSTTLTFNAPVSRPPARTLAQILGFGAPSTTSASDWGNRFLQQARALGDRGIEYDDDWRPPGESRSWAMDCSNTTRYLYKVTAGIQLPRTASDQYYYLHLQGKAWDVPQAADGYADANYLRRNLKPGDLLFWENTYRPERQPPITHVMVYLGTNDKGQWIMAGSQSSRGGEHNRRNGGPDVYVFRPSQPCGGYTTWMGLVHHRGRFCAFGRPLEADPTKLSVAEND
jgi:cell wall-associated NlpC family hydrolase